jgi:hypothetical protein
MSLVTIKSVSCIFVSSLSNETVDFNGIWLLVLDIKSCMPPDEPNYFKKIKLEKNVLRL